MKSNLYLETNFSYGKTHIKDVYFNAPYKIMSPFIDGSHIDVVLMSASAGFLKDDSLEMKMVFGEKSNVTFLSQSYEKVFNTLDSKASKKLNILVKEDAIVKYMPYPMIPFKNSNFINNTIVRLHKNSNFVLCDIFSCGRTGSNEKYEMNKYQNKLQVLIDDATVFADHTILQPLKFQYSTLGMWGKYTHNGLMYIYTSTELNENNLIERIREMSINENMLIGVSKAVKGISIRCLATSGEEIYSFYSDIATLI